MCIRLILLTVVSLKCCLVGAKEQATKIQQFPDDFIWGAGTSSFQVEGAWNIDGKGESTWDHSIHTHPNYVSDGNNADVAANSYEFYKEDVKAVKMVGFKYYRFSISWSRVLPTGDVKNVNELGVKYYNDLLTELLANNIIPIVTIYHWELPQKLEETGGFMNPRIVDYLVDYANFLFERFSDRVKMWITINEPNLMCIYAYEGMLFAPFVNVSGVGPYLCGYHSLLANAKIYHLYHEKYNENKDGKIGPLWVCHNYWPKNKDKPEDVIAATRATEFLLGWLAHPIFSPNGGYPKLVIDSVDLKRLPVISESEKELIKGTSDLFFLNYYTTELAEPPTKFDLDHWATPSFDRDRNVSCSQDQNWPGAASFWLKSVPTGFRDMLNHIRKTYDNPKVLIAENGWSDYGGINDTGREEYFRGHLQAVLDARDDGCDIIGYLPWSLIDTFEWSVGFREKFGLFEVDFDSPNKTRTPRNSVKFFQKVIKTGKIPA